MRLVALFLAWCVLWATPLAAQNASAPFTLVAFGDSLTAGYGVTPAESFPAQLQAALRDKGYDVQVVNAGVSGDTASGGLARLDWSLAGPADAVILELGANDALRGVDPAQTRAALEQILDRLAERQIPVLLAGMLAPPNYGAEFGRSFNSIFPELAESYGLEFYPFFLDGVAAEPDLNLDDGMHPNARGIAVIVERILPSVEALLAKAGLDTSH